MDQTYDSELARAAVLGLLIGGEVDPNVLYDAVWGARHDVGFRAMVAQEGEALEEAHYAFLDRCVVAALPALILRYGTDPDTDLDFSLMDMSRSMGSVLESHWRPATRDLALITWQALLLRAAIRHNSGEEEWDEGDFFCDEAWEIAEQLVQGLRPGSWPLDRR